MSETHKKTVQQFIKVLDGHHLHDLDSVLEHYAEKIEHSDVVYKNIDEAREYYFKEHQAHPSAEWKVLEYQQDDRYNDTLTARVAYNHHIYHTTYTFSSGGKIEKIHSVPEHHHNN